MSQQIQRQEASPVAVAATAAAADVVATMLQVHGLHAWTEAYFQAYPSIAWVEGYRVTVADEDRQAALDVLRALDRTDAAVLADDDA